MMLTNKQMPMKTTSLAEVQITMTWWKPHKKKWAVEFRLWHSTCKANISQGEPTLPATQHNTESRLGGVFLRHQNYSARKLHITVIYLLNETESLTKQNNSTPGHLLSNGLPRSAKLATFHVLRDASQNCRCLYIQECACIQKDIRLGNRSTAIISTNVASLEPIPP